MSRPPEPEDLPLALTVKQTAQLWNCSTDALYEAIARDECPVQVLRIGRSIRLPRSAVLAAVGYRTEPTP